MRLSLPLPLILSVPVFAGSPPLGTVVVAGSTVRLTCVKSDDLACRNVHLHIQTADGLVWDHDFRPPRQQGFYISGLDVLTAADGRQFISLSYTTYGNCKGCERSDLWTISGRRLYAASRYLPNALLARLGITHDTYGHAMSLTLPMKAYDVANRP